MSHQHSFKGGLPGRCEEARNACTVKPTGLRTKERMAPGVGRRLSELSGIAEAQVADSVEIRACTKLPVINHQQTCKINEYTIQSKFLILKPALAYSMLFVINVMNHNFSFELGGWHVTRSFVFANPIGHWSSCRT